MQSRDLAAARSPLEKKGRGGWEPPVFHTQTILGPSGKEVGHVWDTRSL